MSRILIADDERNIRTSLATTFELEGYEVESVGDGAAAVAAVGRGGIDLVVLDLQMPTLDGLGALARLRDEGHDVPVLILSAHGTIERAVEAVRLGAFDFIEKPPHADRVLVAVRNALRQTTLEAENRELRDESAPRYDMIGATPAMAELYEQIRRTAPTQARVLILGENGTGKELVARALHRHSTRAGGPFVRVNCAAIPRELFESELFGHEKGAFTGATQRRRGKFLRAHTGTLFLDEVGEIPAELQPKLLRALESGEVEPVGSERELRVDVRVLAATNRELEREVAEGRFRQDLFYRLQVVTLRVPPLRDRLADVPELARRFLERARTENHLPRRVLTDAAVERLARHSFPGNVRELSNLIERLVILTPGATIDAVDVARQLAGAPQARDEPRGAAAPRLQGSLRDTLADLERRLIVATIERHDGAMAAAARELGLERSHLYKKLKALGIERG